MGQAIEQTVRLYPGLLESNQNLLFMLKCRQFIEMVNGSDFDLVSYKRSLAHWCSASARHTLRCTRPNYQLIS